MTTVIAVLYDTERLDARQYRWPLRIAALNGGDVVFLLAESAEGARPTEIALRSESEDSSAQALAEDFRRLLDEELTPDGWTPWKTEPRAGAREDGDGQAPIRVALRQIPTDEFVRRTLEIPTEPRRDFVVCVIERMPKELNLWREITRELWRDVTCRFAAVVPGRREADGQILFEPSRGPYPSAASPLAVRLAQRYGREATAVWSEPPVTEDSERVGQQLLDRALESAVGPDAVGVERNVEVEEPEEESGLLRAAAEDRFEVCIVGMDRPSGDDFRMGRPMTRLTRVENRPTWIMARAAEPFRSRLLRIFEHGMRRSVPQLARAERADFVARVQSSSEWNFDFIALMGLSTGIATFGLIGDSAAVIIGAMLVAPLMTPLMGIGTAIVQSNLRLATMTARTSGLGFLLAFFLAISIGLLDKEFGTATDEMIARHWPTLIDLAVAFVAGTAAAYATGRPGLLAALPGVAIAASLVPPIAASGLAISLGDFELALGAILLFFVNVVAIVFATALVLWVVGMHGGRRLGLPGQMLATVIFLLTIAIAIGLAVSPPRTAPPLELVEQIESAVGHTHRIREIRLLYENGPLLQIDLGGSINDHPEETGAGLAAIAKQHLGDRATVRISYRHEKLIR